MNAFDEWPSCIVERFDRRMTRLVTLEIQALATSHQVADAKSSTDCASTKTRDSGQNRSKSNGNWIQRFRGNFGVKQSPRNTVLGPPSRRDAPLYKRETKRSFQVVSTCQKSKISWLTPYQITISKLIILWIRTVLHYLLGT